MWNSRSRSILRQILYMYLHQIETVEFIYDGHGQTFLSTLYVRAGRIDLENLRWNSRFIVSAMFFSLPFFFRLRHCFVAEDTEFQSAGRSTSSWTSLKSLFTITCFSLRAFARTRRLSTPEEHRTGRHHASSLQAVEGERRAPLRFLRRRGSLRSIQVVRLLGPAYETSGRRVLRGEPGECCTALLIQFIT